MLETISDLKKQLAELLGPQYVSVQGELLTVQPVTTEQLVKIMNMAAAAKINVDAGKYYIGPGTNTGPGKITVALDLGLMNSIDYDQEAVVLVAQPAAPVNLVCDRAGQLGYHFPGQNCRHSKSTIGESITGCFMDGEPAFKCGFACICGLEMVTYDGAVITTGDKLIKDLNNYHLAYLLAGFSGQQGVLTKIYLKLMLKADEYFWLVAQFNDPAALTKTAYRLTGKSENLISLAGLAVNYTGAVKINTDNTAVTITDPVSLYHGYAINALEQLFNRPTGEGGFLILKINGNAAASEQVLDQIAMVLEQFNVMESVILTDDYSKDNFTEHYAGYWKQVARDVRLTEQEDIAFDNIEQDPGRSLVAFNWQPHGVKSYYAIG